MTTLLPTPGIENLPASVQHVVQQGFLLRFFNDALFTSLVHRACYTPMMVPVYLGQTFTFTKKGLLDPVQDPLTPTTAGSGDLTSNLGALTQTGKEQYSVTINQYGRGVETNALSSSVSLTNLYKESAEDLGLNAGQSLDIQGRRRLHMAYGGGRTYFEADPGGATPTVSVDNIAGFDFVMVNGVQQPTSATNPHPVTIAGTPYDITAYTTVARDNDDDTVRGTLTASVNIAAGAAGTAVISDYAPQKLIAGGGDSDWDVTATDTLTLQLLIDASSGLRARGVKPHEDGFYHAIMGPQQVSQLWSDPAFQRAYQSLPDSGEYQHGAAGIVGGVKIIETQQPADTPAAANNSPYGGTVRHAMVTGKDIGYEARYEAIGRWLELMGASATGAVQFSPEAWVAMILRTPLDALQQVVTNAWSFIGDWVCATDSLSTFGGSSAYYRRGCQIATA